MSMSCVCVHVRSGWPPQFEFELKLHAKWQLTATADWDCKRATTCARSPACLSCLICPIDSQTSVRSISDKDSFSTGRFVQIRLRSHTSFMQST